MTDDVEAVARAICRVQLNGGDPDQHAARWNGTKIELQNFPAWWDYRDEARHAIAALRSLGWQKVEPGMVAVKKPSHDWVKSTLGHGAAMCRKCFISNREAFVLGLMDKCEGVTNDAADNQKPAPISESGPG